jgi:hypothetical protein
LQSGANFTVTPNGFGNDALIITSGNQTAYYAIAASANQFGQSLPRAIGMIVTQGNGKHYSATLPNTVANGAPLPLIGGFSFNIGSPPSIDATPASPGAGSFTFTNTSGGSSAVPYTVFGVSFANYPGGGTASPFEAPTPADEAFIGTGVGSTDTVTVNGAVGSVTATSGNVNVVNVTSTTGVNPTTVTIAPVGAGTTTVTLSDTTGASASYTVSVTTTSIPISSTTRRP